MNYTILAINPGSTSTKVALYKNETEVCKKNIEHLSAELASYHKITDQYEMRYKAIMGFLQEINFDINRLSAVVGRGGILPPVRAGAYKVNGVMVEWLRNKPVFEHASNLAAIIAYEMSQTLNIPAYIYDSVAVDELADIARISGITEIQRKSFCHALNMRAVAIKVANDLGKSYQDMNFVVAHLGGGISLSVHEKGKMVDNVSHDEGPFSPERCGGVPGEELVSLCYAQDKNTVMKKFHGQGGLVSYLGTSNAIEAEKRIESGDEKAGLIYEAMAYQIAKSIGELATVVEGNVDRIILTGGIAHSKMITDWVSKRVRFIAPVVIVPGENEIEALVKGALRVLYGKETAWEFDLK